MNRYHKPQGLSGPTNQLNAHALRPLATKPLGQIGAENMPRSGEEMAPDMTIRPKSTRAMTMGVSRSTSTWGKRSLKKR